MPGELWALWKSWEQNRIPAFVEFILQAGETEDKKAAHTGHCKEMMKGKSGQGRDGK